MAVTYGSLLKESRRVERAGSHAGLRQLAGPLARVLALLVALGPLAACMYELEPLRPSPRRSRTSRPAPAREVASPAASEAQPASSASAPSQAVAPPTRAEVSVAAADLKSTEPAREEPSAKPDSKPDPKPDPKSEPESDSDPVRPRRIRADEIDRASWRRASWADLPGWNADSFDPALVAFLRSCSVLQTEALWKSACAAAAALPGGQSDAQAKHFFEAHFSPWQLVEDNGDQRGRITGYYEPLLFGSRTRSERYRYPLYGRPGDLLSIDLAGAYPDLENKGLRGRIERDRVVPYFSREEIEDPQLSPLRGSELVWVDNSVDALFLHIQGSGQVQLDTGDVMRVGFADQNGHPFRSVATYLRVKGEVPRSQLSMRGIKEWARENPSKVQEFLNFNPRYIFFRELPLNLPGPLGTLGVPLTAERSVAIDPHFIPLGAPVYVAAEQQSGATQWARLMMAQDTGGVIRGQIRADVFWGFGEPALRKASGTNQNARMWVLLPR